MFDTDSLIVIITAVCTGIPAIVAIVMAIRRIRTGHAATGEAKATPTTAEKKEKPSPAPNQGKSSVAVRYDIQPQPYKQGGMATIWLASDRQTGRSCIIKTPRRGTTLDNLYLDKLIQEASFLKRLDHPGIVKYVDDYYLNGEFHLVLEYLEGETMMASSPRTSPPEEMVIEGACQILDALAYIHTEGIIHRDINPKNLMLRSDGSVKIIDFGTAKDLRYTGADSISKDPFTQIANRGFDIPELFLGGDSDGRCDLCGLAQSCMYLLTLRHPNEICGDLFKANWPRTYAEAGVLAEHLVSLGITKRTARCLAQAVLFSPDSRFINAQAMQAALSSANGYLFKPVEALSQQ